MKKRPAPPVAKKLPPVPGRSHECTVKDCVCVHFEADAEQESSFVCMCGHVEEEHEGVQ